MLNVGPLELIVVLAVALIVVGPERLPELARSVGRALRQLRQVQDEVKDMVSLGVDEEVRQAASEFKKASGTIKRGADVKGTVRRNLGEDQAGSARRPVTPSRGSSEPSGAHSGGASDAPGARAPGESDRTGTSEPSEGAPTEAPPSDGPAASSGERTTDPPDES